MRTIQFDCYSKLLMDDIILFGMIILFLEKDIEV